MCAEHATLCLQQFREILGEERLVDRQDVAASLVGVRECGTAAERPTLGSATAHSEQREGRAEGADVARQRVGAVTHALLPPPPQPRRPGGAGRG